MIAENCMMKDILEGEVMVFWEERTEEAMEE
jgi:hypothetical protein